LPWYSKTPISGLSLAFGGDTGLQTAMNNYNLKLVGNPNIFNFFGVMIAVSMGMMKRP
jgi:hypothetical protein